ncbi:MAG TPA: sulfatase-like hydrolase/transferase [Thermoanaerobaculia bacterium]|nr:sulfatase-like hydrolase/transferase [Thermoanaerobaculia bacterium]
MTSVEPAEEEVGTSRPVHRTGRTFLIAFVAAGVMLLLISLGVLPPVFGLLAVAVVLATIFWKIREQLPSILLVFVVVLLASVVITKRPPKVRPNRIEANESERLSRKWAASGRFDSRLPIVVHLLFDEMMSPGAITDDLPGGEQVRKSLYAFGDKNSFRVFDSVYGRYYFTNDVLPNLMGREYLGKTGMDTYSPLPFDAATRSYPLKTNAYFDDLARRGYRTVVFQSTHINYCANKNVDLCETFDSFDPAGDLSAGVDTPTQRVRLWQAVIGAYEPSYTSALGQRIVGRAFGLGTRNVGVDGVGAGGGRYDAQGFPQWFDRFTKFTATVPRGTHVFAHFLVPHAPYLLLGNCVVSGKTESTHNLSQYPSHERAERRRNYYGRYFGQLGCVQNKLDSFMAAIDQSPNFRDAVIIIHGDHGSRISISDTVEDYRRQDFVDNYATFFAVRSPGVAPGRDCEFMSLPQAFRRYVARGVKAGARPEPPLPIVVASRKVRNAKVEAPMPKFGCAGGTETPSP